MGELSKTGFHITKTLTGCKVADRKEGYLLHCGFRSFITKKCYSGFTRAGYIGEWRPGGSTGLMNSNRTNSESHVCIFIGCIRLSLTDRSSTSHACVDLFLVWSTVSLFERSTRTEQKLQYISGAWVIWLIELFFQDMLHLTALLLVT